MQNKGISLVTLTITIIVIVILASIGGYYSYKTISDATSKNIQEEMKNVKDVISIAKAKGLNGEFIPNSAFLITRPQLDSMYSGVLSESQIADIDTINNDNSVSPLEKYYLLDQSRFDSEFRGNDFVTVSGLKRQYLVSYQDGVIIVNDNGTLVSSGNIIDSTGPVTTSELKVVFTPNGNKEWAKTQSATINVTGANISSTKYLWTESSAEPASILIDKEFSSGANVELTNETGNSWYIWVLVEYTENGVSKKHVERSNAFYIDNMAPTGELEVNAIVK